VALVNCTVVGNGASLNPEGGGLYSAADVREGPIIRNTIFADNLGPPPTDGPDIFGNVQSRDYNLIESPTGFDLTGPADHNITGQDPLLGPLNDNGGATHTHALQPGSPALDGASCTDLIGGAITADQRGVARPQGTGCDVGAYELTQFKAYLPLVFTLSSRGLNRAPGLHTR
jgi:hypothetical protein